MEGERPKEGPAGPREVGVRGKECSNEALRLFEAHMDDDRRGDEQGSILDKDHLGGSPDARRRRSGQIDN